MENKSFDDSKSPPAAFYGQGQPGQGQGSYPMYPAGQGQGPILNQPMGNVGPGGLPQPGGMYYNTGPNVQIQMHQQQVVVPVGVPQGLEYLTTLDQIIIKQKIELLEIITGCETKNKYEIMNPQGQIMFKAKEENDCLSRQCCGAIRAFEMEIKDPLENEIIHIVRPLNCQSFCYPCCLQEMEIFSPPGVLIGRIEQSWSIFPRFLVKNALGDIIFKIEGPFCTFSCACSDVDFNVLSADGETKVGKIAKKWVGFVKEAFTDADTFGISFPVDLDTKMKATLLGACFLIDFMYFEVNQNNK